MGGSQNGKENVSKDVLTAPHVPRYPPRHHKGGRGPGETLPPRARGPGGGGRPGGAGGGAATGRATREWSRPTSAPQLAAESLTRGRR